MTSYTLLDILGSQKVHGEHYQFIYKDIRTVLQHSESNNKNKNNVGVRFVSRSLMGKKDRLMRHVFLEFDLHKTLYVSEHNPSWARSSTESVSTCWKDEISIRLPNTHRTLDELVDYENKLPNMYMLGVRDCRHHVSDMLCFCYPDVLSKSADTMTSACSDLDRPNNDARK